MPQLKVLLTGASGYIGGSILTEFLLSFSHEIDLSAVVRSDDHIKAIGNLPNGSLVKVIKFSGLDDTEQLKQLASEYDVVVSAANAMHKPSSEALIEGLGLRNKETGKKTYFIHTSGTSNFGDHPFSNKADVVVRVDTDDIYSWEKNDANGWINREVNAAVIDAGEKHGVQTIITNPPIIFGEGTGPVHRTSIQVPVLSKLALGAQAAVQIGDGSGLWSVVHVSDVAKFYTLVLRKILAAEDIPSGKQGYYFLDAGEVSWGQISQALGKAGVLQGVFSSPEVRSMSTDDFAKALGISFLNAYMVEVIWGSNARIKGEQSRAIGWQPIQGVNEFFESIPWELQNAAMSSH